MSAVLGIDAGGSKTLAAFVDETGRLVHLARSDGLDPTRSDDPGADLMVLFEGLGATRRKIAAATLGLPYFGEIASLNAVQEQVSGEVFGAMAQVYNDVEVAHIGAFAGGDGLLCLAGTGSMAWAKGPLGSVRTGGFGDLIGDEGSAFWIGRAGLALLSHEADGRKPPSAFGTALAKAAGLTADDLIDWTYRHANPRAAVGRLAPPIAELAKTGDPTALRIIADAAAEVAAIGLAAARKAGLVAGSGWAAGGSVFRSETFMAEVARQLGAPAQDSILPPVGGAALDAARRAGWTVDPAWIARLREDLEHNEASASQNVKETL